MQETFFEHQTFEKIDLNENTLQKGEYDNCIFNKCNFSNTNFSEIKFIECTFIECDLSLAKLNKTGFRDVTFKDSKMLGLRFDTCNPIGLSFRFEHCTLNHSIFFQLKIKNTIFNESQLIETDFTECDLTGAVFNLCDLSLSTFENTIIEKADFRTAFNFNIDPDLNRIKKAKFSSQGIIGLLNKYDIEIE